MEYGLKLEAPAELPADPRAACVAAWHNLLPGGRLAAIYFGTEFCEHRLPGAGEAARLCALAREANVEATLSTPVVTDPGLRRLADLLGDLEGRGWKPAVVFNDWGVLGLLREEFPTHPRRAGRLFNRSLRDPRAAEGVSPRGDDPPAPRHRRLHQLLARLGVVALETDPDLEGGYLGDGAKGLQRTVHLPYAFATTGRNCPLKTAADSGAPGFPKGLGLDCSQPCRCGPLQVKREDTPTPLWRAGNTIFSEVTGARAATHLASADRIVLHPRPTP